MPPAIADRAPRPGDDRFGTSRAAAPTLEHVARAGRRGRAGPDRPPRRRRLRAAHPPGPRRRRTSSASARRRARRCRPTSSSTPWAAARGMPQLAAAAGGGPGEEEAEDSGFIYYTRFFRGAAAPELRGAAALALRLVLDPHGARRRRHLVDHRLRRLGDRPLKRLRHEPAWTALVRACPLQAHWLDGEPITGVLAMGGVLDRRARRRPRRSPASRPSATRGRAPTRPRAAA